MHSSRQPVQGEHRTDDGPPGEAAAGELYDLSTDQGETKNIAAENPAKTQELADLLRRIQESGRSR